MQNLRRLRSVPARTALEKPPLPANPMHERSIVISLASDPPSVRGQRPPGGSLYEPARTRSLEDNLDSSTAADHFRRHSSMTAKPLYCCTSLPPLEQPMYCRTALPPLEQLARLNDILRSLHDISSDSLGVVEESTKTPTMPPAELASEKPARRPRSVFANSSLEKPPLPTNPLRECSISVASEPPMRKQRSMPMRKRSISLASEPPARAHQSMSMCSHSISLASEHPVRGQRSMLDLHLEQPLPRTMPSGEIIFHSCVDARLDSKDNARMKLANTRSSKVISPTASSRHPNGCSHVFSTSDRNFILAEWCKDHERALDAHAPVVGGHAARKRSISTKLTPSTVARGDKARPKALWLKRTLRSLVAVACFHSLWTLATIVMPDMTGGQTCARQRNPAAKVDANLGSCTLQAANEALHACKQEFLRSRSALIEAEHRFARAKQQLQSVSSHEPDC